MNAVICSCYRVSIRIYVGRVVTEEEVEEYNIFISFRLIYLQSLYNSWNKRRQYVLVDGASRRCPTHGALRIWLSFWRWRVGRLPAKDQCFQGSVGGGCLFVKKHVHEASVVILYLLVAFLIIYVMLEYHYYFMKYRSNYWKFMCRNHMKVNNIISVFIYTQRKLEC